MDIHPNNIFLTVLNFKAISSERTFSVGVIIFTSTNKFPFVTICAFAKIWIVSNRVKNDLVTKNADKTWKKEVDAKIGDKVEFQIEYKNTSSIWQNDVVIRDILPSNLRYVPGSTRIANSAHPTGAVVQEDDLVEDGIFVGNYNPDANVLVRFTTEVVNDTFTYGKFILHNWGRVSVTGRLVQDSAAVIVEVKKNNNIERYKMISNVSTFIAMSLLIVVILMLLKFWHYTKNSSH